MYKLYILLLYNIHCICINTVHTYSNEQIHKYPIHNYKKLKCTYLHKSFIG